MELLSNFGVELFEYKKICQEEILKTKIL